MTYDCTIDLDKAIDWQRSKATKLKALIEKKQAWYQANHCDFWNDWVTDVFNLETANEFGLSVWSIILDEPLFGLVDDPLTLEQKRIILKLKAYILMGMSGSVPDINIALKRLFGADQIYCLDSLNMELVYLIVSTDLIDLFEEINNRDLFPRPAAVSTKATIYEDEDAWGFGEYFENFSNGNFYDGVL